MESLATFGKTNTNSITCSACGMPGHVKDKCWTLVGYPPWHPLSRLAVRGRGTYNNRGRGGGGNRGGRGGRTRRGGNMQHSDVCSYNANNSSFTPAQIKQLLNLLPKTPKGATSETDEDLDLTYAGMVTCCLANTSKTLWIIDSSSSDHMIGNKALLTQVALLHLCNIKLPTGKTTQISHKRYVYVNDQITLKNVLYVPDFQHDLLSISKFSMDLGCNVVFLSDCCHLLENDTGHVMLIGRMMHGLYYFLDPSSHSSLIPDKQKSLASTSFQIPSHIPDTPPLKSVTLWHNRLGHTPLKTFSYIPELSSLPTNTTNLCLTCPMARFTKLPYSISSSRASDLFSLVYIDIWGAYKVPSRGNHRYFLTLVDDHSRMTWVHLLRHKSDAYDVIKNFVVIVSTQFEKQVKIIRSDKCFGV